MYYLHNASFKTAVAQILLGKNCCSGSFCGFSLLCFLLLLFGRILTQVEESWSEELRLLVLLWLLNDFNL